jgi:hypothetical protein
MKSIKTGLMTAAVNPNTNRAALLIILALLLTTGCTIRPITKEALMGDPQIKAIHNNMSEEEAVAVARRQLEKQIKSIVNDPNAGGDTLISFDKTGFVSGNHYLPKTITPASLVFDELIDPVPVYFNRKTVAFADVKRITLFAGRVYYLYGDKGDICAFYPSSKDRKDFLAALLLLCPNLH